MLIRLPAVNVSLPQWGSGSLKRRRFAEVAQLARQHAGEPEAPPGSL
jgi:hypothetical protein